MRGRQASDTSRAAEQIEQPDDAGKESVEKFQAFQSESEWLGLRVLERQRLLGGISIGAYHKWRRNTDRAMKPELLDRLSMALGLLRRLRGWFRDADAAYDWLTRPNAEPPFGGQTPLDTITRGGDAERAAALAYIDARVADTSASAPTEGG
jgi:hypothetical protein